MNDGKHVPQEEIARAFGLPPIEFEFDEESLKQWKILVEGACRTAAYLRFLLASDMRDQDMNWMTKIKIRIRLWRICRAVGIKRLTEPQKRVLLSGNAEDLWQWERGSGKTLTACLYTLLHQRTPIMLSRQSLHPAIPDPDGAVNGHAAQYTMDKLCMMHTQCIRAGVKVCDIYFKDGMWGGPKGGHKAGGLTRD